MNLWPARFRRILLALAILVLGLAPYPKAFATAMRQAESHLAARTYGAALDAYEQAASSDPGSPLPWLGRGQVLLLQHRFTLATAAFLEAERLGGGVDALLGLGESYAGRGDWAAAIQPWLRARALAPGEARVYVALGRASMAQSQFEQASSFLTRGLQLAPSGQEAATAHALLGRLLIATDPSLAASHFRQAGDQDMLAVLKAVDAEPGPQRRALMLGIAFLQRAELPLARHHFERAVALDPGDAEAMAYLAHTLDRLGETVAARQLLEQALALDGDSALVHYFLGAHHRLAGNVQAAQAALWQALLRDPANAAFRLEMAQAFLDQPDYPRAEEWFQGAVAAAPEEVEFHLLLVHFYLDHLYRIEEGGLPAAQALADLAPDDARAQDLLGWALHLAGRQTEGEQALLQALRLDPNLVSAHYHLGSLYLTTGQRDLARLHLQRAADLNVDGFYRDRAELALEDLK